MKRIFLSFFLFYLFLPLQAQGISSSSLFQKTYIKTIKLNEDRFENLDKIFLGDTILFPSLKKEGEILACVINKFDKGLGLYNLVEKYILGELITFPVEVVIISIPAKTKQLEEKDLGLLKYFNILTIMIFFGLIWLITDRIKYWSCLVKKVKAEPLIPGGLSYNAKEAFEIISKLNNLEIYRIDRGTLRGKGSPKVKMLFGTGEEKIQLSFGEVFYRVVYQNGETIFHRLTCGGKIKDLPSAWHFISDDDEETGSYQQKDSE